MEGSGRKKKNKCFHSTYKGIIYHNAVRSYVSLYLENKDFKKPAIFQTKIIKCIEWKNTITEMKNTLEGADSKLK